MPQWALALVAACVAVAPTGIAYAAFSKTTSNGSNTITATSLSAPTGLTAAPAGRDVSLAWAAATPANGYDVQGAAPASGSSCTGLTFSTIGTSPTTTGTTYTDTNRAGPSGSAPTAPAVAQGTYYCYRAMTRYNLWQSATTGAVAVQVGVVASSLAIVKAGNTAGCGTSGANGAMDCGDQIVITFNQAMDTTTGPSSGDTVCGSSGGTTILLASTTTSGGCNAGTETSELGSLTTPSLTNSARYNATYTWSAGNTVLTITLGGRASGNKNIQPAAGTFTYNPTTTATLLKSSSGAVHVCDSTTGGGVCKPSTTSGF